MSRQRNEASNGMGRRRSSSSGAKGWLFRAVLRFFGISSPAVLIMALLSYMGFKTPVPDSPSDSPDAIAQRAKKIIETVSTAKTKLKETLASFTSQDDDDAPTPKKRTTEDEELVNVTYQELFDDAPTMTTDRKSATTIPVERAPAKVSDNRDKKKIKAGDFPDLNPPPFR